MLAIIPYLMMLALIALPLLRKTAKKQDRSVVFKNNTDTTHAHYAVNDRGYLEEIAGSRVHDKLID